MPLIRMVKLTVDGHFLVLDDSEAVTQKWAPGSWGSRDRKGTRMERQGSESAHGPQCECATQLSITNKMLGQSTQREERCFLAHGFRRFSPYQLTLSLWAWPKHYVMAGVHGRTSCSPHSGQEANKKDLHPTIPFKCTLPVT
jgi:hypothetical protein